MLPKKVKKRASLLSIFLLLSVIGVFLILNALNKNILYFNSPTDIKISQDINYNQKMRVGIFVNKFRCRNFTEGFASSETFREWGFCISLCFH